MKYIMLVDNLGGRHPVLFTDHLTHKTVADGVRREYTREGRDFYVESAGFYSLTLGEVHGRSESLEIESIPSDAAYIFLGGAVAYIDRDTVDKLMGRLKSES